ncbi:MAG: Serine/threonine protein kinase PrkC, regulator of stationary phase [Myxococcaceae bacterium]|nr:Serine/threonine protein kinase PrkC, regulator of stationary phase [Myxococcaceae bacterium]
MLQLSPTAVTDALLFAVVRTHAEAIHLAPAKGGVHVVTLEFPRGLVNCLELKSGVADAVVARLALLGSLDFTARDERFASFSIELEGKRHPVTLSVRSGQGHLEAYLRRAMPTVVSDTQRYGAQSTPTSIGDYKILEELGRGALGVVYRAEHRLLKKVAAIKLWSLPNTQTSKANAALLREARAAAATRHPGVVDVYDILRMPDGRIAMVMELLDGETLSARIARTGALDASDAVQIARSIADVLDATHSAGIVHRDLKPENVFLLPDGRIKVLDFGAALSSARPDEKAGTLGTPWYMAPEQAYGNPPDRRSDLYSLGCVLYEMLTGNCPYDATDPRAVIAKHIEEPVPTPESPLGPLPDALERTVIRSLAKYPEQRHQDAREFARELDAVLAAMARPGWRKWLAL